MEPFFISLFFFFFKKQTNMAAVNAALNQRFGSRFSAEHRSGVTTTEETRKENTVELSGAAAAGIR